jgi:hypothetical protein
VKAKTIKGDMGGHFVRFSTLRVTAKTIKGGEGEWRAKYKCGGPSTALRSGRDDGGLWLGAKADSSTSLRNDKQGGCGMTNKGAAE